MAGADGIQRLLAAEQEAQRIVAEARKAKQERLKQARAEAEREIGAYKAEREGKFQKAISDGSSGAAATLARLTSETNVTVQNVHASVKAKKQQIVDLLISYVATVKYTV